MKVTHVSIRPTEAADRAGRPSLTPELLAASGARYSRNNEGLEAILLRIDPENIDKSVDGIFRMIDYGHQSIADMAPIAMFIDGITIWLAYLVWSQVPTAGGQESSTRYLRLGQADLPEAAELGIPKDHVQPWRETMIRAMGAYDQAFGLWEAHALANPEVTRIPPSLLNDPSDKAQKQVARMQRNYAFDRARYFLPVALRTNMMLVMSARGWVQLCQWLLSQSLDEGQRLGSQIVKELGLSAPRLLRHATRKDSFFKGHVEEVNAAANYVPSDSITLDVLPPRGEADFASALEHHDNRYAYLGDALRRTAVRVSWPRMAIAEIRDLNRHRTGSKFCPPRGLGFYAADDEIPASLSQLGALKACGTEATAIGSSLLAQRIASFPYFYLLGTELTFEHTTTADKFIYEAELRTGTGAHYRYAKHLRDALALWYERFPATKGLVLEGSAEPE